VPITSHPRGLRFCRACGARLTLRSGNPATKTVSLWSGHLAMTVPRASIDERPTRSSLAGRPYLPHLQSTRTGKPAGHPATAPTGDSDEPPVWTRVVRSTTPVVQMNPDDRRLPRDSFAAIPDSSSQSDGGMPPICPAWSPTENPEGSGRSQRIDPAGLRPTRSTPPVFQQNLDDSRPLCGTLLRRYRRGHHGAQVANYPTAPPGSPTENPKGSADPEETASFGLRPTWMRSLIQC